MCQARGLASKGESDAFDGLRVFELINDSEVFFLPGSDRAAPRKGWGAFDSSGLLNRATDSPFAPIAHRELGRQEGIGLHKLETDLRQNAIRGARGA